MNKYRKEFIDILSHTLNEREDSYGDPSDSMKTIAHMWSAYHDSYISAPEMVSMMIMLKLARLKETPDHLDSWIDIAGYASIAYESILDELQEDATTEDLHEDMENIDDEEKGHPF